MSEASSSHETGNESNNDHEVVDGDDLDDERVSHPRVDEAPSRLSALYLEKLISSHPCLSKYNPVLPTKDQRAHCPPPAKVALYRAYFTSSNVRLPLTEFYLKVLSYYQIGVAQMQPVGGGNILTFEMILAALELPRSLYIFRRCFRLCTTGDWFTVKARPEYAKLITHAPGTIKFWRFHYFFVDATFIPPDKTVLLGWKRDVSNKKECSRFIRKINVLPAEHMINKKHLERVRQVSIPYKSYAKCEAILVVAKISQDWEGDVPTLVDESTGKTMGLWESMGVDLGKLEKRHPPKPCTNDEIEGLFHAEGTSRDSPPSRRISFSPERQHVGFDGTSLRSFSSLPTEEESDKAMDTFFEKGRSSTSSPTGGHSLGGGPSGKRVGDDLISPPPKRSMPPFEAFKSFTSSFTSSSTGPLRLSFTGGSLEETINTLEPMRRAGFHCTEYPALQSITADEWNDLRRASAFSLGYDDSTRTFSFPPSRAGSTLVPHPTKEFRMGLGNDYYVYSPALKLKDDVRDPDVARRYADSVVPPLFAAETSFLSLTQLARLYDTHAALSFTAGLS